MRHGNALALTKHPRWRENLQDTGSGTANTTTPRLHNPCDISASTTSIMSIKSTGGCNKNENDPQGRFTTSARITGALTRTYVGRTLAHVDGSNPATGTWRYMYHDHLGSVRQVRDASRNLVAEYAFLPYGQMDAWSGTANATTRLFTGHDRDPLTGQDYAFNRWYSSTMNRWLSRDPLGMVDGPNVYAYVGGDPINNTDPLGLTKRIKNKQDEYAEMVRQCRKNIEALLSDIRSWNSCNPQCTIPTHIGVSVGGLPGYYSFSPKKGHINIHPANCASLRSAETIEHILHEVGHAVRDFSRIRYTFDRLSYPTGYKPDKSKAFWQNEEELADAFEALCNKSAPKSK